VVQKTQIGSWAETGWPEPVSSTEPLWAAQIAAKASEPNDAAPIWPISTPLNRTCNVNA
jgi:hypothetical protein